MSRRFYLLWLFGWAQHWRVLCIDVVNSRAWHSNIDRAVIFLWGWFFFTITAQLTCNEIRSFVCVVIGCHRIGFEWNSVWAFPICLNELLLWDETFLSVGRALWCRGLGNEQFDRWSALLRSIRWLTPLLVLLKVLACWALQRACWGRSLLLLSRRIIFIADEWKSRCERKIFLRFFMVCTAMFQIR